ncbi:hypothetical protein BKA62DRAFT_671973 [Auriculariales sp. MPI-PUGE-AT-0066]|nr:hypothetical protein BKA62DRAFT_671973 [Auriculariales sp. MPI-PUGE-AT-0066]
MLPASFVPPAHGGQQPAQQPRLNIDLKSIGPLKITGFVDLATRELQLDVYYRPTGWNMDPHTVTLCTPAVYSNRVPLHPPDHGMSVLVPFQTPYLRGRIECGVVVTHGSQPGTVHRWLAINPNFQSAPLAGGQFAQHPTTQVFLMRLYPKVLIIYLTDLII